jgi:hypothetical protein
VSQVFTPEHIQGLQSNLFTNLGVKPLYSIISSNRVSNTNAQEDSSDEQNQNLEIKDWENHQFQILVFDSNNVDEAKATIYYETKTNLIKGLSGVLELPTVGLQVDSEFLPHLANSNDRDQTEFQIESSISTTVRFLLQCRKLSQVIASTWLDPRDTSTEIKFIKKILDSYNVVPNVESLPKQSTEKKDNGFQDSETDKSLTNPPTTNLKANKNCFLIKPEFVSYNTISLALLLCGQAYYKDGKDKDGKDKYQQICKPIFSTYEMVWEYAVNISWDTFYATRSDIPQISKHPNPPYTKVTLGYPPKPSELNLTNDKIKEWVEATEKGGNHPFYPTRFKKEPEQTKETDEWLNHELQVVVPPYPYIPLSTV